MGDVIACTPVYGTTAQWAAYGTLPAAAENSLLLDTTTHELRVGVAGQTFASCPLVSGGGGSGSPGGSATHVQFNAGGGNFGGVSDLTYSTSAKMLRTPLVGAGVHSAGAISGVWSPPLAPGCSTITASAAANITLAVPSGATLPSGAEVYLHLLITNTATAPIYVGYDLGAENDQYAVLHQTPVGIVLAGATTEFIVRYISPRWYLVGPAPSRFPITFGVSGVPVANSVLFQLYVHNFQLPGGLWVPWRLDDVGNTTCGTAPTASTVFTVQRSAVGQQPWTTIGTITFPAGVNDYSVPSFSAVTRFDHGDRLRIVAPANLNGLADLSVIIMGVA